ncbi:uncharacterized protein [Nicotiana tomentosiformis]|uniref:Uncharacterized protein n=1 Tax=Nicotiana tabacum TaxID=4097 RepID=A0A1S4AI76_TOBAC|nr:PREDICTED: uncharacterized protein LOC107797912 [Nicotiana tabacum]XP_033515177.1 uncharacterized protein LOC104108573 [Nicotiana tomentosiformis]
MQSFNFSPLSDTCLTFLISVGHLASSSLLLPVLLLPSSITILTSSAKKLLHAISPKLVKASGWFLLKTKDAMFEIAPSHIGDDPPLLENYGSKMSMTLVT